jgi:tetratricopeptide (TPR) repeat protein
VPGPASGVHRVARALAADARDTADTAESAPAKRDEAPAPPARPTAKNRFAARLARTSPVGCLDRAMKAKTAALRIRHARAGLASGVCDGDTQAMLLRQLYLGLLETGEYQDARMVAEQFVSLGVMPDVARHDAARACQALGDVEGAIGHLREAARACPAERRSFHLSTLGGLLYAYGRPAEAAVVLEAALEAPDASAPLVRGQLALARFAAEGDTSELELAYHELLHDRTGEGYGRFVLGELAMARDDRRAAQMFLQAFLAKAKRARTAAQSALKPEIDRATATLGRLLWN